MGLIFKNDIIDEYINHLRVNELSYGIYSSKTENSKSRFSGMFLKGKILLYIHKVYVIKYLSTGKTTQNIICQIISCRKK